MQTTKDAPSIEVTDQKTPSPTMRLVWRNPNPPANAAASVPKLIAECRSRRQAFRIISLLDSGWVLERREGDRLIFLVFEGSRTEMAPNRDPGHPRFRPAA